MKYIKINENRLLTITSLNNELYINFADNSGEKPNAVGAFLTLETVEKLEKAIIAIKKELEK